MVGFHILVLNVQALVEIAFDESSVVLHERTAEMIRSLVESPQGVNIHTAESMAVALIVTVELTILHGNKVLTFSTEGVSLPESHGGGH